MSAPFTTPEYLRFMQLAADRFACRTYSHRPVPREAVEAVIEAARIAPSAKNKQPWIFHVISSGADRAAVARAYSRPWIEKAPVCIVLCADHSQSWRRADGKDHADIDIAIAGEHIALAATALGLASCWVCNFNAMQLAADLQLPEGIEPVVIFPLGYPDNSFTPPAKTRKSSEQIVRWRE